MEKKTRKPAAKKGTPKKIAAPRSHLKMTDLKFELICTLIETTYRGLNTICKEHGTSSSAFFDRVDVDQKKAERYARAKDRQADYMADLITEVAFDNAKDETPFVGINHVHRDRLKIDSLKFIASKLKPKKYGDKLDLTTDGKPIEQVVIFELPKNNRDEPS